MTYLQAIIIGALQGVTELFPVSSLGHSVIIPALLGGSWARNLDMTATDSPYLAFLIAVHVATAIALVVFFRRDWLRIIVGFVTSIRDRRVTTSDQRLAWLLIRGLSHEDAARFAFLLATPVILAAGVLKLPELAGPEGHGVLGQVVAGSVVAGVAAYLSLRFLTRYFETRTLTPFAIYCLVAGLASLGWLAVAR